MWTTVKTESNLCGFTSANHRYTVEPNWNDFHAHDIRRNCDYVTNCIKYIHIYIYVCIYI